MALQQSVVVATLLLSLLLLLAALASATLYEGSPCFHEASQRRGVCKVLPYCAWAVKERRSDLYPQACAFLGYLPVVCCPYTRTHDPPHLPLRPKRPYRPGDEEAHAADAVPTASDAHPAFATPQGSATTRPPPLGPDVGGPLGPLPVPSSSGPGDLQRNLDRRIDRTVGDSAPLLGDGSAAFFVVRPPRAVASS